jgi:hypothetical protein
MVTMSQGERGILEFTYNYIGNYMFHAHKTEFAEKGWMGLFLVKGKSELDKIFDDGSNNNFAQRNLVTTTTQETLPGGKGDSGRY